MSEAETLMESCSVRRLRTQKSVFRRYLSEVCGALGYPLREERSLYARNYIVGDTDKTRVIFLAHYDTPVRSIFPYHIYPQSRFLSFLSKYLPILLLCVCYVLFVLFSFVYAMGTHGILAATVIYLCCLVFLCLRLFSGSANPETRNDNTSGISVLLELMRTLPTSLRSRAAFVFADGRYWGRTGAKRFSRTLSHKDFPVVVLDCVGCGNALLLTRTRSSERDPVLDELDRALRCLAVQAELPVKTLPPGKGVWYSEHRFFRSAMGISLLSALRTGTYALPGRGTERGTEYAEDMTIPFSRALRKFLEQL